MSKSLGTLTLDLIARIGGYTEGLTQAERVTKQRMREIRRSVDESAKRMRNFIAVSAGVVTAGAAVAAAMVNSARQSIDEQNKFSRSLDGTVSGLRALQIAAEDSGIDALDASLNRLNRRLGAVEMGGGPAAATVERLNLNLKEMRDMDVDDRLAYIADRIRDYGGSAQESARHLQQLGFEQRGAFEMFREGGDAIRAARAEAELYGLTLSQIDATRIEEANRAFDHLNRLREGFATQLTIQVSTALDLVASKLRENIEEMGGMDKAVEVLFDNIVVGGINAADTMRNIMTPMKNVIEDIWTAFQSLPPWAQEVGVVGAILGGKKGTALLILVSKAAEQTKATGAFLASLFQGDVGLFEWFTTGAEGARERLKELGHDIDNFQTGGPSIIQSLFGGDDEDGVDPDEWADNMLARYREAVEAARRRAEEIIASRGSVDVVPEIEFDAASSREFERLEESLRRQIALYGQVGEAAKIRYEIESGALADLTPQQQEELLVLAEQLDLMREQEEEAKKQMERMQQFGKQAARNMQTHFADFLFDPFDDGLKGMAKGFADTLRRMVAEAAASRVLGAVFGSMAGSSTSWVSSLGNFFAGAFDAGGTIPPGKVGIVGEYGPEIVRGPALVTGRSETSRALSGGQVQINFSIMANDTTGFDKLLQSRRGQIISMITQSMNNRGVAIP